MNNLDELIIAHRGESYDAPENTLSAIKLAWERNAKSVEIDVHLTKDEEIIVIHDYNTKRISGVKKIVSGSTLKELKQLDAGIYKDIKWKNERFPTLNEVIKTIPSGRKLLIEIKSDENILVVLKDELVHSNLLNSQIEIISFNEEVLGIAKEIMPEYKMLWLLDLDYSRPWWLCRVSKKRIIEKINNLHLDGIDVWAGKLLTREFIDVFKKNGFLVYAWTVNDTFKAQKLIDYGIDGITTDRASWLRDQLAVQIR